MRNNKVDKNISTKIEYITKNYNRNYIKVIQIMAFALDCILMFSFDKGCILKHFI